MSSNLNPDIIDATTNYELSEYQSNTLKLAGDGAGGAIIIWEELLSEPGPQPHRPKNTNHIFAQRIDAEGHLPWGQDSVLLYTTPEGVYAESPQVISDGSGGAIIIWQQTPEGRIEEGSPEALLADIFIQRVDAKGNALWTSDGVPLETHKGGGFPHNPLVVGDGAGGAVVMWSGGYAQKIDAEGNIKWQPGGVEVTSSSPYRAISDGQEEQLLPLATKRPKRKRAGFVFRE